MKSGERCKKAPILGGTICAKHGGRAPHIKAAAKRRLEEASLRLAKELLGMALDLNDKDIPPAVRLAAIRDALDRAGLTPRQALDITHELKPWEELLDDVHRRPANGLELYADLPDGADPDDPRLGPSDAELRAAGLMRIPGGGGQQPDIVDAEVVEEETVDIYADNPLNPDTGRVHCAGCDAPFPAELPERLSKYPTLCRQCRTDARAERAQDRELDERIGAQTVQGHPPPSTDPLSTPRGGSRPKLPPPSPGPAVVDRTEANPRYRAPRRPKRA